jgi:voltage-gated sodium channel
MIMQQDGISKLSSNDLNNSWRSKLSLWMERSWVKNTILTLIIINAITLGLETDPFILECCGGFLHILDRIILSVFVLEILLRIIAHGPRFFKDPWCLFDFIVVVIALLPNSGAFSVLRSLRVLRVLRLFTIVPSMRRVIGALVSAVPGLFSITLLLLIFYYVFAVIATKLFGNAYPEWFGHIGRSLYSLFQIMTLESWSMGISRPVMSTFPYAWLFFIPFVLVATFTMLNLFIAVIVNAMQSYSEAEHRSTQGVVEDVVEKAKEDIEQDLHTEMRTLRMEIAELKSLLAQEQK